MANGIWLLATLPTLYASYEEAPETDLSKLLSEAYTTLLRGMISAICRCSIVWGSSVCIQYDGFRS